jgi:hypothetical protein
VAAAILMVAVVLLPVTPEWLVGPEWGRGTAATGPDETGPDETGADEAGTATIGTADGGMAIDGVFPGPTLSSSVILAFPGRGAGAGVLAGVTRITDTLIMAIRTDIMDTAMDIPVTDTAMVTDMAMAMGMAMVMATAAANMAPPVGRE